MKLTRDVSFANRGYACKNLEFLPYQIILLTILQYLLRGLTDCGS